MMCGVAVWSNTKENSFSQPLPPAAGSDGSAFLDGGSCLDGILFICRDGYVTVV